MNKAIVALALGAVAFVPQIALADFATGQNGSVVTGPINQTTNLQGVVPAATPSLSPGSSAPFTLDNQGNLNVHVQAGANGSAGGSVYPAPSSSPFPVAASTTLPVREQGTVPVSAATTLPVSIATTVPVSCVTGCSGGAGGTGAQYNSTPPTYTSGSTSVLQTDQNGNLKTVAATPFPIQGGNSTAVKVDGSGVTQPVSGSISVGNTVNTSIVASTPLPLQPVTLNVPSPIPVVQSTTAPVTLTAPSSFVTPNPTSGSSIGYGMLTTDQLEAYDLQRGAYVPVRTENGRGILETASGGANVNQYGAGSSGGDVVAGYGAKLFRIVNTSTSAQTATFSCWDNATTGTGAKIWAGVLQASQVVTLEYPASNGIFCQASAATNGDGPIWVTYD